MSLVIVREFQNGLDTLKASGPILKSIRLMQGNDNVTVVLFLTTKSRLRLKCDGTRAGTRSRLSAKRTSPFKLAGGSVQSTTDSRGVCISGSNAG